MTQALSVGGSMAKGWPKAKAPIKPKFSPGDIVKKSTAGTIRLTDRDGVATGSAGATGTGLLCYVIRASNDEYLVQVIPSFDLQSITGRMYKGAFGFIQARHLTQTPRERSMTEAKVYDGEKFHEDRMKNAKSKATASKGRSHMDR